MTNIWSPATRISFPPGINVISFRLIATIRAAKFPYSCQSSLSGFPNIGELRSRRIPNSWIFPPANSTTPVALLWRIRRTMASAVSLSGWMRRSTPISSCDRIKSGRVYSGLRTRAILWGTFNFWANRQPRRLTSSKLLSPTKTSACSMLAFFKSSKLEPEPTMTIASSCSSACRAFSRSLSNIVMLCFSAESRLARWKLTSPAPTIKMFIFVCLFF